tara:strand:- start:187 stop:591 length:405 start_codon:yes stop_codon:yes gene_type:complete
MPALRGKPLAFPTVESLQEAVDAYFKPGGDAWDNTGDELKFLPTMSGLALALDVDRKTVLNYSNKDDYFPTIRKARAIIENNLEKNLYGNSVTGLIFNLKNNFGWNDKQELDHTSNGKTLNNWSVNPVTTNKDG